MSSDRQARADDISYFFEGDRVWPPNWLSEQCAPRFQKALVEVFRRLDEDAFHKAEELWFVIDAGHFHAINIPRDLSCPPSTSPQIHPYDTIFITNRAWQLNDKALIGLLAHEIAHSIVHRPEYVENEVAADDLVRKWGFDAELAQVTALREI